MLDDLSKEIQFACIVHSRMSGKINFNDASVSDVEKVANAMRPSVQRRMLKFVNQARCAQDLTKSPQERREKYKHHGAGVPKPKSDR